MACVGVPRRSDTAISRAKTTRGLRSLLHLPIPTEEKLFVAILDDNRSKSCGGGARRALQKSALPRS